MTLQMLELELRAEVIGFLVTLGILGFSMAGVGPSIAGVRALKTLSL